MFIRGLTVSLRLTRSQRQLELASRMRLTAAKPFAADRASGRNYEHTSSRTFLFCGEARRDFGGRSQYSLRHPATSRERAGRTVGGISGGDFVSAAAVRAHCAG